MLKLITFRKIPTAKIEISRPELHHSDELTEMDYVVKANYEVLEIPVINNVMYSKAEHKDDLELAKEYHEKDQRIKDFITGR